MWEFHSLHDGSRHCWAWQRFLQGRLQHFSGPVFSTMTEALEDASSHGFEMHRDRWDVLAGTRQLTGARSWIS